MAQSRFESLVLPHLDAGYNLARWLARDAQDAQDIVQDACVRALRYIDKMRDAEARAWFLAIVRNAFYDWCGKNRPGALEADGETAMEALESAPDPHAVDPAQAVQQRASARILADAVRELPTSFREVFILRELEGLAYQEIAQIVGVPIGTVMSRLSRARTVLQASPALQELRA
jgi:RNA polymerase sigma-70 factor (ECF subfamily)